MTMNIKRILCFGDSNTYGWAGSLAGPALRYPSSVRWTGRLGALLGPDWEILEEGLGGRTLRDPVTKEGNTIPPFWRRSLYVGLPARLPSLPSAAGRSRYYAGQQ